MAAPIRKVSVEFFYDVISAYSWFAFEVLCRYESRWNIGLKLKPIFLGGLFRDADNRSPFLVPNKSEYNRNELPLLGKYFDVPLNVPQNLHEALFDKGSLRASRFVTAVDMLDPTHTRSISQELWMQLWSYNEDITEEKSFYEAGVRAGLKEEQIQNCLKTMTEESVKNRLRQYTDEAHSYGAFGSPTIIVHVETPVMLYGSDRFPILAQLLGKEWEGPNPGLEKV